MVRGDSQHRQCVIHFALALDVDAQPAVLQLRAAPADGAPLIPCTTGQPMN
jgi:hypothetical protein